MTTIVVAQNDTIPVKVGVVLDLETPVAKIWLSCIDLALSEFYASHSNFKTRLLLNTRDSNSDVVAAAAAVLDLIKNVQVQAILGPQKSTQAKFIIDLGQEAQVPILSFSASSPTLTSNPSQSSYFFRTAPNDSSQVKAISSIVKAFGWREVVPIYTANEFGEGIIPYLVDALEDVDAKVPYRSAIPPLATDDQITTELYKLMTMQTRVFVVHIWYNLGSRLLAKANEIGMMDQGFVWIITQDFTDLLGSLDPSVINSMQGVIGIKSFVPQTKELDSFQVRWKSKFQIENPTILDARLNVMGLWAYDSVYALALAVEKIGSDINKTLHNVTTPNANKNSSSTDLDSFGVSPNGPKLWKALSGTSFRGIAGNFSLVNGQLETSTFQLLNVNGVGGRTIGFWTQQNGLTRTLSNSSNAVQYSTSRSNLGPIIWPGDAIFPPKGWDIPTNGKRLRIGIPVKAGFREFVKVVNYDPITNISDATGFTIDVFEAAVKALPYALPYDYFPFAKPNGASAGTYDDLVHQVYLGNYDAVVADSTIRANRSQFVDFTLPYTESGVVMVVPMIDNKRKSAWVFLKPLTWDLWVTSFCFFVFIGFVVWVLEHRINEDFRGPPLHQVGTSFWFSFSTMVFAHRERVVSNLARFVVIIWVFVVLILTQSYTASLTSLLTVEQLKPTVTDINQLLQRGEKVGYLGNSFVYGLLIQTGFPDSRIVPFKSAEEGDELLSLGTSKGGIGAVVDETPNMRLFLARYCSKKYTMIGPIFKTAGFGFVFPKGSPLVADVSMAILNVTEGDDMKNIENKWFNLEQNTCSDSNPSVSSDSLSLGSFWGLFIIAGVSSLSALIIFVIMFLHKHKQILFDSRDSVRRRLGIIFRSFDEKDLSSHTFRKSQLKDGNDSVHGTDVVVLTMHTNCPPSPSSYTVHTGSNSPVVMGEHGTIELSSGQASPEMVPAIDEYVLSINNEEVPRSSTHSTSLMVHV
ncbi:Ionotropic glutamate receptor [Parasponia andersonii]|uniref:Glutamate receptor n=1 Tax=Parasponia andersonii TaxID=3476 RepID=A0A2P5DIP7_PARAD|nr:Ionotropic glutamate receptor [Parasponia andersonii]